MSKSAGGKAGRMMVLRRKVGGMRRAGTEETRQEYRLRFGHSGLNSTLLVTGEHITGRRDYCGQEGTIDHNIKRCEKNEQERRQHPVALHNIQRPPVPVCQNQSL